MAALLKGCNDELGGEVAAIAGAGGVGATGLRRGRLLRLTQKCFSTPVFLLWPVSYHVHLSLRS
ncbi:MAG: hypothetical protein NVSMB25_10570 [Thermoleophilaceae bacterium]